MHTLYKKITFKCGPNHIQALVLYVKEMNTILARLMEAIISIIISYQGAVVNQMGNEIKENGENDSN